MPRWRPVIPSLGICSFQMSPDTACVLITASSTPPIIWTANWKMKKNATDQQSYDWRNLSPTAMAA